LVVKQLTFSQEPVPIAVNAFPSHISVSAEWQLWLCSENLCGHTMGAVLPTTVKVSIQGMAASEKTKLLMFQNQGAFLQSLC